MARLGIRSFLSRLLADYGMVGVLLLLCLCCTLGTLQERKPQGPHAARMVAARIAATGQKQAGVVILARDTQFADALEKLLTEQQVAIVQKVTGKPAATREVLQRLAAEEVPIAVIATTMTDRLMVEDVKNQFRRLSDCRVVCPESYWWPAFLTLSNLLNVANKNVVIAVIAVGMTMVIITGGIDLSVGSLVALSAVVAAALIVAAGGKEATPIEMVLCSLGAVGICAAVGSFSGTMITLFKIPPFVVTLAMMWVASGLAYIISGGESIADLPESYNWLGMDADLLAIPNTLILMIIIYVAGHVVMSRTTLGRHIYAIGGNRLAAQLSGIRVNRVLLVVYTISGAMAGIGGVMLASQFVSGTPTYGRMYELYAIAAVVVGGTSLAGGEGKIFGTLIGVLVIAVVQNAMNLLEIGSYKQNVVLGLIVLVVVLLDMLKRRNWRGVLTPE